MSRVNRTGTAYTVEDSAAVRFNAMGMIQKIGFIPDRPYLYEKLTGNEFLKFCADIYRVRPENFIAARDRYLSSFAMHDYADHLIESYSHGMKQRRVFSLDTGQLSNQFYVPVFIPGG